MTMIVRQIQGRWLVLIGGHICWNSKCRLPLIICWLRKTKFSFPFTENKRKFAVSVFHLQQTNRSYVFLLIPFSWYIYVYWNGSIYQNIYRYIYIYEYLYIYAAVSNEKGKTEAPAIFHNLFTVCSSCKRKFVICLFVDEETNESYQLANRLNILSGLNRLAHICWSFNCWSSKVGEGNVSLRKDKSCWVSLEDSCLSILLFYFQRLGIL
jgi:hypothetical protein